jgi:hypothetical protein
MVRVYCDRCGKCVRDEHTHVGIGIEFTVRAHAPEKADVINTECYVCGDCNMAVKAALREAFTFNPPNLDVVSEETVEAWRREHERSRT